MFINAVTASKSGTSQLVLEWSWKGTNLKKKTGDGSGEGRTSSHGLWFRNVLNALCLWSGVSRGRGRLRLLDLCPLSEIASLLIEIETCDG